MLPDRVSNPGPLTYESGALQLQWLEYLWNHEIMFETGVVRANEC